MQIKFYYVEIIMAKSQTVFQTPWFSVEQVPLAGETSLEEQMFYRVNSPDGVIILAMTSDEEIILVRQFRLSLNQYTLELPSGFIKDNELPQDAAMRELTEETGYVCESMELLGCGRIMMNRHNSQEYAFYGMGAVKILGSKEEKDIEVELYSVSDFKKLVLSGEFEQFPAFAPIVLAAWKSGNRNLLDA